MRPGASGDSFLLYAGLTVVAGMLGILGAYVIPTDPGDRLGAFIGVGSAVFSGVVALTVKQRVLSRVQDTPQGVGDVLLALGIAFVLRVTLVALGLVFLKLRKLGPIPFTVGFFGEYFVLQWIEIGYVMAEQRRRRRGD